MEDMEDMDSGCIGWMVFYSKQNFWRIKKVTPTMQFIDLLQEGRECYYYALRKYPGATTRRHIMAMFKLVFRSRVEFLAHGRSIARNNSCNPKSVEHECDSDGLASLTYGLTDFELSSIYVLITEAPPHIKALLEVLNTEEGVQKLRADYKVQPNGHRETTNERLLSLIGCTDNSLDLVGELQSYFS
jgi:hypothetical protein